MPAAGYRNCNTGVLTGVGGEASCWSSSSAGVGSSYAGFLRSVSNSVNPMHLNNRSWAFPVRCVQHLPGSLFEVKIER